MLEKAVNRSSSQATQVQYRRRKMDCLYRYLRLPSARVDLLSRGYFGYHAAASGAVLYVLIASVMSLMAAINASTILCPSVAISNTGDQNDDHLYVWRSWLLY